MNDQPQPAAAPATPPLPAAEPAAPADDGKAGGGIRALAVLLALVLAFGAAVMIIASGEIADTPTFAEVSSGEKPLPDDGKVYDGTESERSISTAFGYASGIAAAIAALLGVALAITGRRGKLFAQVAIAAVVLAAIALLI
jgi:hypothetical protein